MNEKIVEKMADKLLDSWPHYSMEECEERGIRWSFPPNPAMVRDAPRSKRLAAKKAVPKKTARKRKGFAAKIAESFAR